MGAFRSALFRLAMQSMKFLKCAFFGASFDRRLLLLIAA